MLLYFCLVSMTYVPLDQLLVPTLAILMAVGVLQFLSFLLLRDIRRAGIYSTLVVWLFYSSTFMVIVIFKVNRPDFACAASVLGAPFLKVVWLVILFLFYRCLRSKSDFQQLTIRLNQVSLFLVALEFLIILFQWIDTNCVKFPAVTECPQFVRESPEAVAGAARPDIYYIILDKMACHEALSELFHYDNGPFLEHLRRKNFYIATNSYSNYPRTHLSLASSLNMSYLQKAAKECGPDSIDQSLLNEMIRKNALVRCLKSVGYKFINISSYYGPTAWIPDANENVGCGAFDEFTVNFFASTWVGLFDWSNQTLEEQLRAERRSTFRHLIEVSKSPVPKFVFAHILLPHEPYLFKADGTPQSKGPVYAGDRWTNDAKQAYLEQLRYTEKEMEPVIDQIIANSKSCPIIVLQSDHGTESTGLLTNPHPTDAFLKERFGILNAYLLPEEKRPRLYDKISPVNSFRLILNSYFNFHLPLLEDRSYYSPSPYTFRYTDETAALQRNNSSQE